MVDILSFVLATNNSHKIDEFRAIFEPLSIHILSLNDVGLIMNVDETGSTFLENSKLKTGRLILKPTLTRVIFLVRSRDLVKRPTCLQVLLAKDQMFETPLLLDSHQIFQK